MRLARKNLSVDYWIWCVPLLFLTLALGSIWDRRAGAAGDYFAYVFTARVQFEHPEGVPAILPELDYPRGESVSAIPELFSEPFSAKALGGLARVAGDPVLGVWLGVAAVTVFNILGTWIFFWRRKRHTSAFAVLVSWSVIALLPWWWARSVGHWHLSFLPLLLGTLAVWLDLFVDGKRPPSRYLWAVPVLHGLLLGQSIYYGTFMIIFVGAWSLAYAPRIAKESKFRNDWFLLVALAALGFAADVAWVIQGCGGIAETRKLLSIGKHELWQAYVYSNRVRELIRGAPGSPSYELASLLLSGGTSGNDAEGFPAPFPKMAILLCGLVFWRWRAFRNALPRGSLRPISKFMSLTVLTVLLTGMQEITWIKFHILFPIFPFIGSYARMFIVLMIVFAFWFGAIAEKFEIFARARPNGRGLLLFATLAWFTALLFDYGFDWRQPILDTQLPCAPMYRLLKKEGHPIFLSGDTDTFCRADLRHAHAITGLPILRKFWEGTPPLLLAGTPDCSLSRARILEAQRASHGPITWLFSGKKGEFETHQTCFGPNESRFLYREATPDDTESVLSRVELGGV